MRYKTHKKNVDIKDVDEILYLYMKDYNKNTLVFDFNNFYCV